VSCKTETFTPIEAVTATAYGYGEIKIHMLTDSYTTKDQSWAVCVEWRGFYNGNATAENLPAYDYPKRPVLAGPNWLSPALESIPSGNMSILIRGKGACELDQMLRAFHALAELHLDPEYLKATP